MKKLILLLLLFSIKEIEAQDAINYQTIVRNTAGTLLANKPAAFRISLLAGSINGTAVYTETHTDTTNTFGLISLKIGKGTVVSGLFSSVDWSTQLFMKVEIDPNGGNNFITMGTTQLLSVPYAFYAKDASTVKQAKTLLYLSH